MAEGVIQQAHTGARAVHYHSQHFGMTRMVKPLTETEVHPEQNLNGGRRGGGGGGGCIRPLMSMIDQQPQARA